MAAPSAPFDWNIVLALTGVGSLALAGGAAMRSQWSDRHRKREKDNDRLERIEVLLAGRPEDPQTHMPGQKGFVDEVHDFMLFVRGELSTNGGRSLKDTVLDLQTKVTSLTTSRDAELQREETFLAHSEEERHRQ